MASKVVTLRITGELLERIDQAAKAIGRSRTAWLLDAAEAHLDPGEGSVRPEDLQGLRSLVSKEAPTARGKRIEATVKVGTPATPAVPDPAPRYRCPGNCDPTWRPASPAVRCPRCRSVTVPA